MADRTTLATLPSHAAIATDIRGPNLTGIDPETNQIVPLFNPREDRHSEHFAAHGIVIFGLTPTGRTKVRVLAMNSQRQLEARSDLEAS